MTDEVALEETPVQEVAPEVAEERVPEKMISASRVEELIKKAKLKGRDAMQDELEALRAENNQLKSGAGTMGGMASPIDPEAMRKQILEDLQGQFQQENEARAQKEMEDEARRLAEEYNGKMKTGASQYEDFSDVTADFNPAAFPNLVYLANQAENTPAVIYELMKNPTKLATVSVLSERDPQSAANMINRISESIKANEQAKAQEQDSPAPLGRMQSSPLGRDTGQPGLADFKRMFRG